MERLKKLLDIVAAATTIPTEKIVSKTKQAEVCYARKIFVSLAKSYDVPTSLIAKTLNRTPHGVNYLHTMQDNGKIVESLRKEIKAKFESDF